jgi:hypothetical protein
MKRRNRTKASPVAAAMCGAAAGLVGGLALIALDRLVVPRLGDTARRERKWDEGVSDMLARVGVPLSPRRRAAVGIAAGLGYATLLGAGYGLARQRWQSSPATLRLVDATLVYAASFVSPDPRRRSRVARHRATRSDALSAVRSASVFGTATAAAYRALSRRVG